MGASRKKVSLELIPRCSRCSPEEGRGGQEQDGAGSCERKERGHFAPGAAQAKHSGRKESHVMQRSVWPFGVPRARPRMET